MAITVPARGQWTRGSGYNALAGPVAVLGNKIFAGNMSMAIEGDPPNGTPPDSGLWISADTGRSWRPIGFSGINVISLCSKDSLLLAGTLANGIFLSFDTGQSWTLLDSTATFSEVSALAINGNAFFAGGTLPPFIWRSTDKGRHWIECNNVPFQYGAIAVTDSFVFVGTNVTFGSFSSDDGISWGWCDYDKAVAFAGSGNNLFAASALWHGIWQYQGDGWRWVQRRGLGINDTCPLTSMVAYGNELFAGTHYIDAYSFGYVYRSTDSGDSWQNASEGIDWHAGITSLAILGDYLIAGDENEGMLRRPLSEMIGPSAVAKQPMGQQNIRSYPNPLSQSTTISFTPETSGYADVSIVNLLGVEVAHLFSGEVGAGEHSFLWNPATLPDGMYECLVRMNGRVETLPLILQHQ